MKGKRPLFPNLKKKMQTNETFGVLLERPMTFRFQWFCLITGSMIGSVKLSMMQVQLFRGRQGFVTEQ